MPRKPESEVMDDPAGVESYASAAAQKYLDSLDDVMVAQVMALVSEAGPVSGRLLDVGCGPGGITLKIARKAPHLRVIGVDYSMGMMRCARHAAEEQGLSERARFVQGDGNALCLPSASFDYVISNSVLHHLADPRQALREMARVARPRGALLVRDLCRPSRPLFLPHVWWHGRYYSGLMKKLYRDSVQAAYTVEELQGLLASAGLEEAGVFEEHRTHLGFVWRLSGPGVA